LPSLACLLISSFRVVTSFQAPIFNQRTLFTTTSKTAPAQSSSSTALYQRNWILSLFEDANLVKKRKELKQALLQECKSKTVDRDRNNKRLRIESILAELALVRPLESTASSPLLRKAWNLYVLSLL
jgi:hypothetical protein